MSTEYGGPDLMEFPVNRQYVSLIMAWSQTDGLAEGEQPGGAQIAQLYDEDEHARARRRRCSCRAARPSWKANTSAYKREAW